jgi:(E)-4-hydroxy-3-methylbut-2-enyl-diphosphate synthase
MVYLAGKPDHKMDNGHMIDHIVELVEAKAAELDAVAAATSARTGVLQAAE